MTSKTQNKSSSALRQICYGDYIFLKVLNTSNSEAWIFSANGFHSRSVWAGKPDGLNLKSYRNCLFQIKPNQHNAEYEFLKSTETQFNLLVTLNSTNELGQKYLGSQLSLEKEKEGDRSERIELLNEKETFETQGKPLVYGGKFTLQHVESGMYLEGSAKMSQLSEKFDLKLVESPISDMFFELKTGSGSTKKKGDSADYTEKIQILIPKLNYYLALSDLNSEYVTKKIGTDTVFLQSAQFPAYPTRRFRPVIDNSCTKIAVSNLTSDQIMFVNYQGGEIALGLLPVENKENEGEEEETTKIQELKFTNETAAPEYLKTGEYIRLNFIIKEKSSYLTIYNNNPSPKIFFQAYESLEYEYNYINTVFQVVKVPKDKIKLPIEEPVCTANPLKRSANTQSYYLRHVVSGKYLYMSSNGDLNLVKTDELTKEGIFSRIQFVAKPHGENEFLHRSSGFKIKFVTGEEKGKYLVKGESIKLPTANLEKNTTYFFGFNIPDNYLIKTLRPSWFQASTTETTEISLKYSPVSEDEMKYILEAECLAYKLEDFLDFCSDLRNPSERKQIQDYNKKLQEEKEKKQKQDEEEARKNREEAEAEAKRIRQEKRKTHDEWLEEEVKKRKVFAIKEKKRLANPDESGDSSSDEQNDKKEGEEKKDEEEEFRLDADELAEINIEAENAVIEREELAGIYAEDYLESEELEALNQEAEEEDDSCNSSYFASETSDKENISFGTEEDEALKKNIQILVESGNAQGDEKERKRKTIAPKKKIHKPEKKKRARRQLIEDDIEIDTNKEKKEVEKKEEPAQKTESKKKKRRRLARAVKGGAEEEENPDKFEKESLLSLAKQMKDILETLRVFMKDEEEAQNQKKISNSESEDVQAWKEESQHKHHNPQEQIILNQVKQWVVREFRIIDYVNVILYTFLTDNTVANMIKALQTKYLEKNPKDEDFYDFDLKTFNVFARALIELLFSVTKRDDLNHLYNSQFVRLYIHFLTGTGTGVYRLTSRANLLATRKLILECCKEFLWDKDLDALGQLNHYSTHLFSAIRDEDDYEALYIQLLDNQCRSKAPNLDNKMAALFITDFVVNEEDLKHTFPKIEKVDGNLTVYFTRKCKKPDLEKAISLKELCNIRKQGKTNRNEDYTLTEYLINAFRLLNSISNLNHLVFFQIIIKHYPLSVLEEAVEQTSTAFFEFSTLAQDAIKNIHFNYFKLPIEKFPVQIQIVGNPQEIDKYHLETNQAIDKNMNELLSDIEKTVLEEKQVKEEVMKNLEIYTLKKKMYGNQNHKGEQGKKLNINKDIDQNIFATLAKLRSFLETSIEDISIPYLKETNELFCGILAKTVKKMHKSKKSRKVPENEQLEKSKSKAKPDTKAKAGAQKVDAQKAGVQKIDTPKIDVQKADVQKADDILKDAQTPENPSAATKKQKFGPDTALEILRMYGTIDNKFVNIAAIMIMKQIKLKAKPKSVDEKKEIERSNTEETARLIAGQAFALTKSLDVTVDLGFDNHNELNNFIAENKESWKTRQSLYEKKDEKSQKTDSKTLKKLNKLKEKYKKYSTDSLIKTLFEMILFKKSTITREVINELRKISNFENNLYTELKKMTMISNPDDMKRVSETIKIVSKLNYYSRMYQCKEFFNKDIPKDTLKAFYKDEIDGMLNYLLFSIYKPTKHFRYNDPGVDPEKRFLDGFIKFKADRWDKPFKLNPDAINRTYQKIFLTLQVPKALFQLISMTIKITGDTYKDMDYIYVIRKAMVILCAFCLQKMKKIRTLCTTKST